MRFLIDECLSVAMAVTLREADHDAEHVTELGLAGRPDDVVMEAARTQDRVLVSADTDFGALLARTHHTAPSVVLFRGIEVAPDRRNAPRSRPRSRR